MPTPPPAESFHRSTESEELALRIGRPLLAEVVNFGLVALYECYPRAREDYDYAALLMHHQALDFLDAFRLLVVSHATGPARLQLRGLFEATIGLQYLTMGDSQRRGYAYLVDHTLTQIEYWQRVEASADLGPQLPPTFGPMMDDLRARLQRPGWPLVHDAFVGARTQRQRENNLWPRWYAIDRGPTSIAKLAMHCGRQNDYERLYGHWSSVSHASDIHFRATYGEQPTPLRVPVLQEPSIWIAVEYANAAVEHLLSFFAVADAPQRVQAWKDREGIDSLMQGLSMLARGIEIPAR